MKSDKFWRQQFREADRQAEYWKNWTMCLSLLLIIATLVNLYLAYR